MRSGYFLFQIMSLFLNLLPWQFWSHLPHILSLYGNKTDHSILAFQREQLKLNVLTQVSLWAKAE